MLYEQALSLANKYRELLSPGSTRIEIVGSVKRGDQLDVKDIEFLIIPDERRAPLKFGHKIPPINFYRVIGELEAEGLLQFKMGASKQRKYAITEVNTINPFILELWIVREETWGIQNVIRTGPALFSHAYVTNRNLTFYDEKSKHEYHGLLPEELEYLKGETMIRPRGGSVPILLPEERDALAVIGYGWVEPKDRRRLVR